MSADSEAAVPDDDPGVPGDETYDLAVWRDTFPVPVEELLSEPTPELRDVRQEVLDDVVAYFEAHDVIGGIDAPSEAFIRDHWFDFSYLDEYEEVTRKWVNLPYAYVTVLFDPVERELRYHVVEVQLDEFETFVREDLTRILRNSLMYQTLDVDTDRRAVFETRAKRIMTDHAATVEEGSLHKVFYYLLRDFIDYGEIDPIMRDSDVEDVSCDGIGVPVFVYHRTHRDLRTNVAFGSERLTSFTVHLAQRSGKHISVSDPLVDASLPDGSRVQLTLGSDVSTRGSNFTIRKFADVPYTPVDLVAWNTFSLDEMAYFWLAIENNKSLVFAGGTGSGKTTSMNAVSFFVPPNSKVVSIEDTREITLPHDNWIQSVTRAPVSSDGRGEIGMYRLLKAALRQRPEYLLVGEIRTQQRVALTFFQAMATGHTTYTTIHADSIESALSRLQNAPLSVPAQMIQEVDVIAVQKQIYDDDRRVRRAQTVAEVLDGEDFDSVRTRTVFRRDPRTDVHERVAESAVLRDVAEDRGWSDEELAHELAIRREVLAYLLEHDVRDYHAVTTTIHTFAKNPEFVLERMRDGEWHPDVAPEAVENPHETEPQTLDDVAVPNDDDTERHSERGERPVHDQDGDRR